MVNIPYHSSASATPARIDLQLSAMRRTAGAIVLALVTALLVGTLLQDFNPAGHFWHELPLDDPALAAIFTA